MLHIVTLEKSYSNSSSSSSAHESHNLFPQENVEQHQNDPDLESDHAGLVKHPLDPESDPARLGEHAQDIMLNHASLGQDLSDHKSDHDCLIPVCKRGCPRIDRGQLQS